MRTDPLQAVDSWKEDEGDEGEDDQDEDDQDEADTEPDETAPATSSGSCGDAEPDPIPYAELDQDEDGYRIVVHDDGPGHPGWEAVIPIHDLEDPPERDSWEVPDMLNLIDGLVRGYGYCLDRDADSSWYDYLPLVPLAPPTTGRRIHSHQRRHSDHVR